MRIKNLFSIAIFLSACATVSFAGDTDQDAHQPDKADIKIPEAMNFVSEDTVKINGRTIEYTATAGTLLMKDEDDKPIALFGYTAYVKTDGDRGKRPILFAYNGGPGSASMWLHMGILGPQRTVVKDTEFTTSGPFERIDNEYSILDKADLVMIDPVGTGFSQPVGEAKGEDFWGVDQDIESVSNFIARYTTDNGRWSSPKYLLGESYGGIRSGGVAHYLLTKHSIALNGVILVSPYMDFIAGNAGLKIDLPYINYFSTYAATAWYHNAIEDRPDDLQAFLREAEAFAFDVYAPVLLKGHRASSEERARVLAGMERFTGCAVVKTIPCYLAQLNGSVRRTPLYISIELLSSRITMAVASLQSITKEMVPIRDVETSASGSEPPPVLANRTVSAVSPSNAPGVEQLKFPFSSESSRQLSKVRNTGFPDSS